MLRVEIKLSVIRGNIKPTHVSFKEGASKLR